MKMIVGLGNPGTKYEKTKHNVGFMVIDELAKKHQVTFKKNAFQALVGEYFENAEKILLVKPQTFMNESGKAVGPLMTYFNIYPEELVIVYDDLDLTLGKIRLRQKGSAGGHNGVRSVISHLNSQVFNRIKVGIARPKQNQTVVHHVLTNFDKDEQPVINQAMDKTVEALEYFIQTNDFMKTMNQFN